MMLQNLNDDRLDKNTRSIINGCPVGPLWVISFIQLDAKKIRNFCKDKTGYKIIYIKISYKYKN